jgi:protoheme IX farnesyltransferase
MKTSRTENRYIVLTKPTITALSVLMAAGGLVLAPVKLNLLTAVLALLGTAFAVASANVLNMYLERETDGLMKRTRSRPLPSGRMNPNAALGFGIGLGVAAMLLLAIGVNVITAVLGCFALLAYVFVYTPLKRKTPLALIIGAVPGAIPPLMGWTAATGEISAPGLVLFAILLLWQLPHFLAIAMYSKADYARAGILTVPVVRGDRVARLQALAYATMLVPVSLLLVPLGVAGWLYFSVASAVGVWFALKGFRGFTPAAGTRWARQFFFASLIYLPVLTAGLMLDALI